MESIYNFFSWKSYFGPTNEQKEKEKQKNELEDKLLYVMHINLYGCFFSDNPCDWIYPTYSIERSGSLFLFALRYENGYLWVKVEKVGGENLEDGFMTHKEINWLKSLSEKDFILVYSGTNRDKCSGGYILSEMDEVSVVQMEFKKWIGTLNVGYSDLLDRIHLNFRELVDFFGAKMPDVEDENGVKRNLLDIGMEEKMKFYQEEKNNDFGREEIKEQICATYYYQGMNDFGWNKKYNYEDWKNLSDAVETKLKILLKEII